MTRELDEVVDEVEALRHTKVLITIDLETPVEGKDERTFLELVIEVTLHKLVAALLLGEVTVVADVVDEFVEEL